MDQGSGTYTVLRQLVAQELQVPLEAVNLETLDSTQVEKDAGLWAAAAAPGSTATPPTWR